MIPHAEAIVALFSESAPDGVDFTESADTLNGVGVDALSEDDMNTMGTSVFTFMTFLEDSAAWIQTQDSSDPRYDGWVRLASHCGVVIDTSDGTNPTIQEDADDASVDVPDGHIGGVDLDAIDDAPQDSSPPPERSADGQVAVAQTGDDPPSRIRRRHSRDAPNDQEREHGDQFAQDRAAARHRMLSRADHSIPSSRVTDSDTERVLKDPKYVSFRDRAWALIQKRREDQITERQFETQMTRLKMRILSYQGGLTSGFAQRARVVSHLLRFINECRDEIDNARPQYFQAYFFEAGPFND